MMNVEQTSLNSHSGHLHPIFGRVLVKPGENPMLVLVVGGLCQLFILLIRRGTAYMLGLD